MDCLQNIIGIRNQCGTTINPNSIYWINDLPSISLKEVDAALDSEYASAIDMIEKKMTLAGDLMASRMQTHFNRRYKGGSVIENSISGYFQDDLQELAAEAYLIGKQFTVDEYPYLEFFISRIGLHVNTTGTVNVFVYDLISDKLLDTIAVTAVAGDVSYVDIYKSYKTNGQKLNLFIGYDATAFISYKTLLSNGNCSDCNSGLSYSNKYISISQKKVLSASSKVSANLLSSSGDGLSVQYSLNCTFEPFVCSVKHLLAEAIWYKAGELLMKEMRYSKRLNSYITIYESEHKELALAYREASEASLANILQNMRVPNNLCFHCNQRAGLAVALP